MERTPIQSVPSTFSLRYLRSVGNTRIAPHSNVPFPGPTHFVYSVKGVEDEEMTGVESSTFYF